MTSVLEILGQRGLIEAVTDDSLVEMAASHKLRVYCGFDPTADGLHLGNMVALMGLAWFERCGHTAYSIVGGATGMIGDPSGKSTERNLLDEEAIRVNSAAIAEDIQTVLSAHGQDSKFVMLNNYDWFRHFGFIEF